MSNTGELKVELQVMPIQTSITQKDYSLLEISIPDVACTISSTWRRPFQ